MPCVRSFSHRTRAIAGASCLLMAAAIAAPVHAGPFGPRTKGAEVKRDALPVAVFGTDDRTPLDASEARFNDRIGVLVSRGANICTAFCVAPDAIATASHCLFGTEQSRAPDPEKLSFSIGAGRSSASSRLSGGNAAGIRKAIRSGTSRLRVTPPIDAVNDWAIVRLETPICRAGGLALSEAPREEIEKAAAAGRIYQVAMHRDVSAETLFAARPCLIAREFPGAAGTAIARDFSDSRDVLLHTCDTGPGSSGSPLLIDGPFGPEVVGINVGTYILSHMSEKDASGDGKEVSAPIANTAIATSQFKAAVDGLSVMTGALPTLSPNVKETVRRTSRPRIVRPGDL